MPFEGGYYTVAQGDNLSLIAARFGFKDPSKIQYHAENHELMNLRDPDILYPGDVLYIPKLDQRDQSCGTDKKHKFVFKSPRKKLKLVIQDAAGKAIVGQAYELTVECAPRIGPRFDESKKEVHTGNTGPNGQLEHEVPLNAEAGTLKIGTTIWNLKIGHLNPEHKSPDDGVSGIQARLKNLGFDPGPVDGIPGRLTEAAIRAFQRHNPPLAVDGICGPKTLKELKAQHGR